MTTTNDLDVLCSACGIARNGRTAAQLLADPAARRKLEAALKRRELAPLAASLGERLTRPHGLIQRTPSIG